MIDKGRHQRVEPHRLRGRRGALSIVAITMLVVCSQPACALMLVQTVEEAREEEASPCTRANWWSGWDIFYGLSSGSVALAATGVRVDNGPSADWVVPLAVSSAALAALTLTSSVWGFVKTAECRAAGVRAFRAGDTRSTVWRAATMQATPASSGWADEGSVSWRAGTD